MRWLVRYFPPKNLSMRIVVAYSADRQ